MAFSQDKLCGLLDLLICGLLGVQIGELRIVMNNVLFREITDPPIRKSTN